MHGIPDAGSIDRSPHRPPPDWPEPGTPLAGEEPTVELPVITEAMLAAAAPTSSPTLAGAALSLALNKPSRARRTPALERRGPRPAPRPAATRHASLDDLLTGPPPAGPAHAGEPAHAAGATDLFRPLGPAGPTNAAGAPDPTRSTGPDHPLGRAGASDPAGPTYFTPPADGGRLDGDAGENEPAPGDGQPEMGPAQPGRGWLVGAGIAAAALLLTGAAVVALSRDGDPGPTPSGWGPPVAAAPAAPHLATAARDGRTSAGFDLIDGAERVTLRAADLGDTLYRITTPDAGAVVPRTDEQGGRVRLRLDGDAGSVDITLNAAVRWDLRIAGGAQLSTIDLSAGRVGGVDLAGGASRIALRLPRPDGTLSVRMSGGVSLFDVRTAERTPVRVRVGRGAGQVTLDGQRHAGVAAGRTFTPASWAAAVDRVDVDAAAGMSALTVAPY
ncbi:hypothetical protein ACWEOZ_04345 [Actinoplanes sp. NPDC004185]